MYECTDDQIMTCFDFSEILKNNILQIAIWLGPNENESWCYSQHLICRKASQTLFLGFCPHLRQCEHCERWTQQLTSNFQDLITKSRNTLWGCQFPVCNAKWLKNDKLRKAILSAFYNISQRSFGILLILWCSFKLWWTFCRDLFRSKLSL
jgi:hypothetical protein